MASIFIRITGTIGGTVGAVSALGFASIINRVRLRVNGGIELVSISGWGYQYMLRDLLDTEQFDPVGQSNGRSAVTATTVNLDMWIPLRLNSRDPLGLFYLQNEATNVELAIDWTADTTVTATGTFSFTAQPILEVFTLPSDLRDWPPLNAVVQILEEAQSIGGAGEVTYSWPRGNIYAQIAHGVGIGASGTDNFTNYAVRVNQSDYLQNTGTGFLDMQFRSLRGRARPAGVIPVDFMASSGLGNYGLTRDVLNSKLVTNLDSVIQAAGAGTLYTVRRQIVPVAPPPPLAMLAKAA